ncbi:Aspartate/glutamate/uridylate kinase [Chiua virens]|nr:Aspartate/glutamate/uridylate kinase [Chiua virens]
MFESDIDQASSSSSSLSSSPPSTPPNLHQNTIDPSARWLVQKFGGTSVGKFAVQIARDIVSNYIDQHKVAIVCSARSGSTKALGTTNLLLKAASEAKQRPSNKIRSRSESTTPANGIFSRPAETPSPRTRSSSPTSFAFSFTPLSAPHSGENVPEFVDTVDLIRSEHLAAAKASIQSPEIWQQVKAEINRDCDSLRAFLYAAQVIDEVSPRSRDSIVGFGERLGCKLMTAVLRDQGIDAEYISLEDIVPVSDDGDLHVEGSLDQSFYDSVATAVGERIKACAPRVPVVTGFFGPIPGSLLRQVGRGYTDLLSALLAVGLDASELQIWKEVDGIFTADPRKVPTARLIPIIWPDEAAELTYYGSEVVHPFTMEQVIRRKIPIRIKNVENPKGGGTVIHPDPDEVAPVPDSSVSLTTTAIQTFSYASPENIHQSKRLPTAVTIKERIVILNVHSNRKERLSWLFRPTSEVHVSMAIEDNLSRKLMDRLVAELQKSGSVSVHADMTILSLVGKQMHNLVGILRSHVPNARSRQRQHRDDQPRRERDQHLVCHTGPRRRQGAQLDPSELLADQTGRRAWKSRSVVILDGSIFVWGLIMVWSRQPILMCPLPKNTIYWRSSNYKVYYMRSEPVDYGVHDVGVGKRAIEIPFRIQFPISTSPTTSGHDPSRYEQDYAAGLTNR